MKKNISTLLLLLLLTPAVFSQEADLSRTNKDYVRIISYETLGTLAPDALNTFKIEVEYELSSLDQGLIMAGFNSRRYNSYLMDDNSEQIVENGRGRITITASTKLKDWGGDLPFKVYVNLSPWPHGSSWSPLSSDKVNFNFREPDSEELTDSQKWALSLTGIISVYNNMTMSSLNSRGKTEDARQDLLTMMKRDWGITNTRELLKVIDNLGQDGHSAALDRSLKIIDDSGSDDHSIMEVSKKYQISQRDYNYLKFVISNYDLYKDQSIKAWDLGRIISLCRWGYECGFISKAEAWEKILFYAREIQPLFDSWEDYGRSYVMGRVFWASGFGKDLEYLKSTEPIIRDLLSRGGYWDTLEWNVELTQ